MSNAPSKFTIASQVEMPAVGFGTYLIAPDDAAKAVSTAISLGYRHIDTAEVYRNEAAVGAGISESMSAHSLSRDDLFVTTKLWPGSRQWGETPRSRAGTIESCEASLARLGLDYVDLYLIHAPLGGPERLEQWAALLELKEAGKVRAVGVSNYGERHLGEIEAAGLASPDANQIELHPWSQKAALVADMRERKIAPIAYSSLVPLASWRAEPGQDSGKTDEMRADTEALSAIAARYGVAEAQLLLRWGIQNGYAVLPKSLSPERMRQNLDVFGFSIAEADLALMTAMDKGPGVAWQSGDPTLLS